MENKTWYEKNQNDHTQLRGRAIVIVLAAIGAIVGFIMMIVSFSRGYTDQGVAWILVIVFDVLGTLVALAMFAHFDNVRIMRDALLNIEEKAEKNSKMLEQILQQNTASAQARQTSEPQAEQGAAPDSAQSR